MSRAMLVALVALVLAVVALVVAITEHSNPRAAQLQHFAFPPPLEWVRIGDSPADVRRKLGRPRAVHRYSVQTCWDYVFPTSTPRYRLCFLHGRLAMRTPF